MAQRTPKKQLNADQKLEIIQMRMKEMTCKEIGNHFGVHQSTIYKFFRNYDERKSLTPLPRTGRPPKLSASDVKKIQLCIKRDRRITVDKIQSLCSLQHVHKSTIRRAIRFRTKFKNRLCKKKPFISVKNMRKRILWCKQHQGWSMDDWKHVVWSDESPFTFRCKIRPRAWMTTGDQYNVACMQGTLKHDKKINVWGCFADGKIGKIHLIDGIMDRHVYLDILKEVAKPCCEELFPDDDYMFMQDNDPKHTSKSVLRWIKTNINTIDWWPAQSPDLNPIENLWSKLNKACRGRQCCSEEELFNTLKTAWNNLDPTYLTKLVESMPNRMFEVLKSRGGPTRY